MLRKGGKLESKSLGYLMILPALFLMLLIQIYPLFTGISYSFQNYQLNRPKERGFIGFKNFIEILTSDEKFYSVLLFTFLNAFFVVLFSYVAGLVLALLLNRNIFGRGIFRAVVLLPWIISNSVSATNWTWLLNDQMGFINTSLKALGLIDQSILFLADMTLAKMTVIVVGAWKSTPFMMIVLLAGLQGIPKELYESASIDGAGFWKSLRHITLPSIRSVTTMCTTLMFIWTFNNFETIYLLTAGGPNEATFVLPIHIYYTSFYRSKIGYGSAIAVIVLIIMMIAALIRFRLQRAATD